ncbi:MAG: undecaprenyl-diphosphatase UppP [Minisyncoccota bacterium]
MDILQAALLGVIEGITEFLPISSTGHLILASELLNIPSSDFLKSFEISIQFGAILSVVALYWRLLLSIETLKKLAVGFVPTGIIGLAVYPFLKSYLLDSPLIVLASLFLGGIVLIVFELLYSETPEELPISHISYTQSFIVGLFQSIAIIPGVSRSAATILGGLMIGIPRRTIVEFSFLLAVPTMAAATGLDLMKNLPTFTSEHLGALAVGFVVSFVVALLSIKFLLHFVRNHTFIPFGIYRIVAAAAFFFIVL